MARRAARPRRASRPATLGLSIGLAVCLVAALAVGLGLHTFGGSDDVGPAATTAPAGVLLTVRSDGVVALLSPATGAVVRTLVGPSPVDADGRHLSRPDGVAAAGGMAYVAYLQPEPVIESIPFAGGVPRYVTDGMYPSANRAGTELAFVRLPPATNQETDPEVVVIRDLATGSERVVDQAAANGLLQTTSWSSNGTELVLSGLFIPGLLPDAVFAVQLLDLDQPLSSTNPRFVGTPKAILGARRLDGRTIHRIRWVPGRPRPEPGHPLPAGVEPAGVRRSQLGTDGNGAVVAVLDIRPRLRRPGPPGRLSAHAGPAVVPRCDHHHHHDHDHDHPDDDAAARSQLELELLHRPRRPHSHPVGARGVVERHRPESWPRTWPPSSTWPAARERSGSAQHHDLGRGPADVGVGRQGLERLDRRSGHLLDGGLVELTQSRPDAQGDGPELVGR